MATVCHSKGNSWLCFSVFVALSFTLACASLLRLENNAYHGIVVALSPDIPQQQGGEIIQRIQELFRNASSTLFEATQRLAYFGQITILVPESWEINVSGHIQGEATYETFEEAQIRVDNPNPSYGDIPYTQQPRGCGEPGDFIHFTPNFLKNMNQFALEFGDPAKILVHEWAHLRYGVFDEYGYKQDKLYPRFYRQNNVILQTGCSDQPIEATLTNCQMDPVTGLYGDDCIYQPNFDQSNVQSSLMFMHFLPNVNQFCTNETHNSVAPTKHNAMCNGRSTWDVISKHEDFKDVSPLSETPTRFEPIFRVVRKPSSKYVLLVDTSQNMNHFDRFSFIKRSVIQLINYALPSNSQFGFIAFDGSDRRQRELTPLNTTENKMNIIKDIPTFIENDAGNVNWNYMEETIKQGITLLKESHGGSIILITAGISDQTTLNEWDLSLLCRDLQNHGIRLFSILHPLTYGSSYPAVPIFTELAEKTNGRTYFIYEKGIGYRGNVSVLAQLNAALMSMMEASNDDVKKSRIMVHEMQHYGTEVSGEFIIDNSIGQDTQVVITPYEKSSVSPRSVLVTSPDGTKYDAYTDNIAVLDQYAYRLAFPLAKNGTWRYSLKMSSPSTDQPLSVMVTSQPVNGHPPIRIRSWTNIGNQRVHAGTMPVIIYAEVKQGNNAVINAQVIAKIDRPKKLDSQNYTSVLLDLFDNGNGASDITKDDGIYSRHFTSFVDDWKGHYSVTIFVNDNNGRAEIIDGYPGSSILPMDSALPYCCGSTASSPYRRRTGPFQRVAVTGTFYVDIAGNGSDTTPPNRITDLYLKRINPALSEVVLGWTAPGDDYDTGTAASYEVRYNENSPLTEENFPWAPEAVSVNQPKEAGTEEELIITHDLQFEPRIAYYAIRSRDRQGNVGRLSNVIQVYLPSLPPTEPPTPSITPTNGTETTSLMPGGTPPTQLSAIDIGIILGCIAAFLLLVILVVCCLLRRRKKESREPPQPQKTKPPVIFPTTLPVETTTTTETEKTDSNGHIYTIDTGINPNQFMSASELLYRHEMQKSQKDSGSYILEMDNEQNKSYPEDYINHYNLIENNRSTIPYESITKYPDHSSDVGSLSDKPSSSFTSLSTNERHKDNGYFTSYEETSEDSGTTHPLKGKMTSIPTLNSSKTSLARRIISESQV